MLFRCLLGCINQSLGLGKVCMIPVSNLSFSRLLFFIDWQLFWSCCIPLMNTAVKNGEAFVQYQTK